jgi:CxC2 like cysteine cluster associated with KDZ transposases
MLRDWLPLRDEYLQELLRHEAPLLNSACPSCLKVPGTLRCKDCYSNHLFCQGCILKNHVMLPFHRLEHWQGGFFRDTSLHQQGYMMHLGHGGAPCPSVGLQDMDDGIILEEEDIVEDTSHLLGQWEVLESHIVVVVDCSGVHQRRISWCYCSGAPEKHIQLLRHRLFPATIKRPSTVFTFNVLEYFQIDAVECKTAAFNFFSKLRRLTNSSVPGAVPVSFLPCIWFPAYQFPGPLQGAYACIPHVEKFISSKASWIWIYIFT